MEIVNTLFEFIIHLDEHLALLVDSYGIWTYLILFLIIFVETGFVIMPFLPGDSLLFAVGALAAMDVFNITLAYALLFTAAVLGDTVNYWIGSLIGGKVFERDHKLIKKEYLIKTQKFYDKHGGKTIIIARFIPIVRTFAPFVAGVGTMKYNTFILYNIVGAFLWVTLFMLAGFFFGNIPAVKSNFEIVIFAIVVVSVIPMIYEYARSVRNNGKMEDNDQISSKKTSL